MTQTNNPTAESALRSDQSRLMGAEGFSFSGYERDPLFLNLAGKKVLDISGVSGVDSISDGRAGVFADFDNDGDTDIFMNSIQGAAHMLFRNNVGAASGWLRVTLTGDARTGPEAFGTQVRVKTTSGVQTKVKSGGEGYLSQHDPRLLFGLAKGSSAEWIEVYWPGGRTDRFDGPFADGSELRIRPGIKAPELAPLPRGALPDSLTRANTALRPLALRIGMKLPDLEITETSGARVPLAAQRKPGRRLLVNLWATWCGNCAREMPQLDRLAPALARGNIDLCGISVDTDAGVDIAAFASARKLSYPLVKGGSSAAEKLFPGGKISVPITLLLSDNGTILDAWSGWNAEVEAAIRALAP
ncbi:MAG: ASPIC/UnbV domain-containing protein [Planctomycetota bacterium]